MCWSENPICRACPVSSSPYAAWARRGGSRPLGLPEAFRAAHANAGQSRREGLYLGPPKFEGFEVIQTISEAGET